MVAKWMLHVKKNADGLLLRWSYNLKATFLRRHSIKNATNNRVKSCCNGSFINYHFWCYSLSQRCQIGPKWFCCTYIDYGLLIKSLEEIFLKIVKDIQNETRELWSQEFEKKMIREVSVPKDFSWLESRKPLVVCNKLRALL